MTDEEDEATKSYFKSLRDMGDEILRLFSIGQKPTTSKLKMLVGADNKGSILLMFEGTKEDCDAIVKFIEERS